MIQHLWSVTWHTSKVCHVNYTSSYLKAVPPRGKKAAGASVPALFIFKIFFIVLILNKSRSSDMNIDDDCQLLTTLIQKPHFRHWGWHEGANVRFYMNAVKIAPYDGKLRYKVNICWRYDGVLIVRDSRMSRLGSLRLLVSFLLRTLGDGLTDILELVRVVTETASIPMENATNIVQMRNFLRK